jgi:hypothetical protein
MLSCELVFPEACDTEEYGIEEEAFSGKIKSLRENAHKIQSQLDNVPQKLKEKILESYDLHSGLKSRIRQAECVTNAWLKCFELGTHFKFDYQFVFFNAEFPGAFICCVNHMKQMQSNLKRGNKKNYVTSLQNMENTSKTRKPKTTVKNWAACSYVNGSLIDSFSLYTKYPENWIMNENMNGDMTCIHNIHTIKNEFHNTVTLYTADGSVDIKNEFHRQEELNFKLLIGEILCGLHLLCEKGSAVIKLFGCLELYTISVVYIFASHFQKCHIVKPATSRSQNSELYIVGTSFTTKNEEYIQLLEDALDHESPKQVCELNESVLESFYYILDYFQTRRNTALTRIINSINENKCLDYANKNQAQQLWLSLYCIVPVQFYLTK